MHLNEKFWTRKTGRKPLRYGRAMWATRRMNKAGL